MRRKPRRSRRTSRDLQQRKKLVVSWVLFGLIALVAGSFLYLRLSDDRVPVDATTMCPVDGPLGYTAILIDGTDSFSEIQIANLKRYFSRLKESIDKHHQLAVYAPTEMSEKNLLRPLIKLCNPGYGEGVRGITENPQLIRRRD